jgi:hypothetical protein
MPSSSEQQRYGLALCALLGLPGLATGAESIEFVGEHLPEIAMDNRYASLPIWNACEPARGFCQAVSAGYARTHSATLSIDGPMLAVSVTRPLAERARLTAFAFFDELALAGGDERRPLDVLFATPPLALPVAGKFTNLAGSARHSGAGLAFNRNAGLRWLPAFEWSAGLMWERVALRDYAFDYEILDGPQQGISGTLDYSASYTHVTPFAGLAWTRARGRWSFTPHAQFALPLPRRGVVGHITGPSFDLAGSTDTNGHGKHFGDPALTLGFDLTYQPWHLTIDLGSTLTQAAFEPLVHEGVQHNWMVAARWLH